MLTLALRSFSSYMVPLVKNMYFSPVSVPALCRAGRQSHKDHSLYTRILRNGSLNTAQTSLLRSSCLWCYP